MKRVAVGQCRKCLCKIVETYEVRDGQHTFVSYEPPKPDCTCDCHHSYNMIHGIKAVGGNTPQ